MNAPTAAVPGLADLVTIAQAARLLPGRPHAKSVARWVWKGVAAPDGRRVRLRFVRAGRRVLTCEAWILEFLAAQTPPDGADNPSAREPRPADQQRLAAQTMPARRQATAARLAQARAATRRRK